MSDLDEYDSSDDDFGPPPVDPWAHLGQESIECMLDHAFEDRAASKKNVKHLLQVVGSPKAQMNRAIVWNRFTSFYTITLKRKLVVFTQPAPGMCSSMLTKRAHRITDTPAGQDIERFFFAITKYMKPVAKSVPRWDTMKNYLRLLITKLIFQYPKFSLSPNERSRIANTFKEMLDRSLLTKDPAREAQWVGITLVKKMVIAVIEDATNGGTRSWDVTVSKILTLVLLGTLGARGGDLAQSDGYKGLEYSRWSHMEIKVKGPEPSLDNLRLKVTVAYEKGYK